MAFVNSSGSDSGGKLVKVLFTLEDTERTETLWAEALGGGKYRLQNSTFFAYGVSFLDVVLAVPEDGMPIFQSVVEHSGHSTYRIIPDQEVGLETYEQYWKRLEVLGCTYEGYAGPLSMRSIDVPCGTDIRKVCGILEEGIVDKVWDFEEAHCGHPIDDANAE